MKRVSVFLFASFLLFGFTLINNNTSSNTRIVAIDVGHGGMDSGAKMEGVLEKDLTMAISKKIKQFGEANSIHFIFTRENDSYIGLSERISFQTQNNADLLISLHVSKSSENLSGIEIYYPSEGEYVASSKKFSTHLSETFTNSSLELKVRNIKPANFYVLKNATCPSVLLEAGFLSNDFDREFLTNEQNQELLAQCIIRAIEASL